MGDTWQSIAKRKQEEQLSRIPKEWMLKSKPGVNAVNVLDIPRRCGLLSQQELDITEKYDATALAQAIATKRLKCVDVTKAFCKRAAIAHQLTNCLTEIFFDDAISRAEYLDRLLEETGKPIGCLHGVPVSLKDSFNVTGYDSSIGIASLAFKSKNSTALTAQILLEAGAVLYCKTNIPQTLMTLDSINNLFGRTLNPYNNRLTAGGSSGGEGALIAMRGSVLGVGTDVGGSIRIPAMCNGIYGIKPSAQRVSYVGLENGTLPAASNMALPASAGPLAVSLRDCGLFFEALETGRPWERDPAVTPFEWQMLDFSQRGRARRKPRIGVVRTDGLIEPLPPIKRLIEEVASTLRSSSNVDVVELDLPLFKRCQSLANAFFNIEGANHILNVLEAKDEPLIPWLQGRLKRKEPKSLEETRKLHEQRTELETEFLKIWKDAEGGEIDAFICPVAPHPTPPIDRWNGVSYTSSFVLLDYPAGTIPVRLFNKDDLAGEVPDSEPLSSWDRMNRELWTGNRFDRTVYLGSPLCIQVVAPKLQEKRLYDAMEVIDSALQPLRPDRQLGAKL